MIGRVRSREEFANLSRSGHRTSATFLWCNWCLDSNEAHPKLAFAVTRAYGSAVMRNRFRRRARTVLAQLDARQPLPPVTMLIGVRRPKAVSTPHRINHPEQTFEPTYAQIEQDLTYIVRTLRRQVGGETPANSPESAGQCCE